METKPAFKPENYNSLSPYFVCADAQGFMDLLKEIFGAVELRKYNMPDGSIAHAELLIDDTVLMLADANSQFTPNQQMVHVYVKNSDEVFQRAINAGCESVQPPKVQDGDPDRRGTFKDKWGNMWSVGTQEKSEE